jgi:hypothetical protein
MVRDVDDDAMTSKLALSIGTCHLPSLTTGGEYQT